MVRVSKQLHGGVQTRRAQSRSQKTAGQRALERATAIQRDHGRTEDVRWLVFRAAIFFNGISDEDSAHELGARFLRDQPTQFITYRHAQYPRRVIWLDGHHSVKRNEGRHTYNAIVVVTLGHANIVQWDRSAVVQWAKDKLPLHESLGRVIIRWIPSRRDDYDLPA